MLSWRNTLKTITHFFQNKACIITKAKSTSGIPLGLADALPPTMPAIISPAPVTSAAPTIPIAPATPASTSLYDIMLLNMIQQQQQQLRSTVTYPQPPALAASAIPAPTVLPTVTQVPSVLSAPQSPAKFQLPDVSLAAFCQHYSVNAIDQERLEKLEYQPGDKIDSLPEDDWKTFAGFTSLSWRRIIEKNYSFVHDAQNGHWA